MYTSTHHLNIEPTNFKDKLFYELNNLEDVVSLEAKIQEKKLDLDKTDEELAKINLEKVSLHETIDSHG